MIKRALFLSGFIFIILSACRTPILPSPNPKWEKEIAAFETMDKKNPPPQNAIFFLGSSSFRIWKSLPKDFSDFAVVNRGFGGSCI